MNKVRVVKAFEVNVAPATTNKIVKMPLGKIGEISRVSKDETYYVDFPCDEVPSGVLSLGFGGGSFKNHLAKIHEKLFRVSVEDYFNNPRYFEAQCSTDNWVIFTFPSEYVIKAIAFDTQFEVIGSEAVLGGWMVFVNREAHEDMYRYLRK